MIEKSLVLIKPDGVQRGLIGEIIKRFERAGLKIVGMKMIQIDKDFAKEHYPDDLIPVVGGKTKKDWDEFKLEYSETVEEIGEMIVNVLREFISSGPVVAMALQGVHAVENIRKLVGVTGPRDSMPGTIRGDFAHVGLGYASANKKAAINLIHASGNVEEAKKEINLWFDENELYDYKVVHEGWTH